MTASIGKFWRCLPVAFFLLLAIFSIACSSADDATPSSIDTFGFEIVNSYPHDPEAFTQGLVYQDGWLYEGTGLYGRSSLRIVDLETGEVIKERKLPERFLVKASPYTETG
jgi:glutamine cyclotransferase